MAREKRKSVDVFNLQEKIQKHQATIAKTRTLIHKSRGLCADSRRSRDKSRSLIKWSREGVLAAR
jgi:hypothetical protein